MENMNGIVAAVLCGGEGKRLRPLTYYFQKAMIPVGTKQKPLIEYIVRLLRYHGLTDVVLLVGYKGEQVVNYFDDGSRFGVKITYVWDNPSYPGNAGALYNAYLQGVFDNYRDILVYYGDILTNLDIAALVKFHRERKAIATLALSSSYNVSVGVVEVDGTEVKALREKPPLGKPVFIGILVMKKDAIKLVKEILDVKESADIMGDLMPLLLNRGIKIEAYITDVYWYDLGTTEKYEKLSPEKVDKMFLHLL